jgi:predicted DNA-binding protein
MTASQNYKKELYSLPIEIVNQLVAYAHETKQKKSHIVAEAITTYIKEREKKQLAQEAKSLIGMIHANTPDIQEIKAHKYD